MTVKAVAEIEHLHESTVKDLDKLYMQEQIAAAGRPAPRAIGVDEISIRKGHTYRVIVSDLERGRPIWVGGEGRTEADMDLFYAELGPKKSQRIELAAMDMWRPFRQSLTRHAPKARVVYDKFHIVRHLGDALDAVRRSVTVRGSTDRQIAAPGSESRACDDHDRFGKHESPSWRRAAA